MPTVMTPHERFRELQRQYEAWKDRFKQATTDAEKEEILSSMGLVLGQLFVTMGEIRTARERAAGSRGPLN